MITVISPFLNEIRTARAWYENVTRFADEIIVADTGSTDGTREFFEDKDVQIMSWRKLDYEKWNSDYNEWWVREAMRTIASCQWIVPLDMDELVGEVFLDRIKMIRCFPEIFSPIHRIIEFKFWGDKNTLRVRSLWPPVSLAEKQGKKQLAIFNNWRGMYPNRCIRIFKNIPEVTYAKRKSHCFIQYAGLGRWTFHAPFKDKYTVSPPLAFYHYHWALPPKPNENRESERDKKVKTIAFVGKHPVEIKYIEGLI